jgi:hypothetical protein
MPAPADPIHVGFRRLSTRFVRVFAVASVGVGLLAAGAEARLDPYQGEVLEPPREERRAKDGKAGDGKSDRLPEVANAAGEPLEVTAEACEDNLALAASRGLRLPDGWKIYCVGPGLDWEGGSHWGVTCPYSDCPEGAGPYVSISNPTYYVVAHELCHANFGNDELMADNCAAEHGASLAESPYQ